MKTPALWLLPLSLFWTTASLAAPPADRLWDAAERLEEQGLTVAPGVKVGATVEVEGSAARQDGKTDTDLVLATAEAWLEVDLAPGVKAEASVLWEQNDTEPAELDTAFIELGGTDEIPLRLSAGRMYLPFGAFNSFMISDPLTLELGETREEAVAIAYDTERWNAWIGAFSGERSSASGIKNAVAALAWTPCDGLTMGTSYSTDIGEGAGYLDDLGGASGSGRTPGLSVYLLLERAPVSVALEYLGACGSLTWRDADNELLSARPRAWHVDVAYELSEVWTAALRYEESYRFKPDEMPRRQCGAALSWQVAPCTTLGLEYLFGTFAAADTGNRHLVTAQLAIAF